jgi:hypothetical protein
MIDENELKTKGFSAVMEKLEKNYGGTAKAIKDGVLGPSIQFNQNLGELGETIGGVTLPALNKLAKAFNEAFKTFGGSEQNKYIDEFLGLQKEAQKILTDHNSPLLLLSYIKVLICLDILFHKKIKPTLLIFRKRIFQQFLFPILTGLFPK